MDAYFRCKPTPLLHILDAGGFLMDELMNMWRQFFRVQHQESNWWERKKACFRRRHAKLKRVDVQGCMYEKQQSGNTRTYDLNIVCHIEQGNDHYTEEIQLPYQFDLVDGKITNHMSIKQPRPEQAITVLKMPDATHRGNSFSYNRDRAIAYANKWWNSYNPDYETFRVDCTNYVSQCLYAGGAPMRGEPVRENGWWYTAGNWSFSWSVAHSLRWYLMGSESGLTASELTNPEELTPGDVICYDFASDGRWDHNTIVVAKDNDNMPLVNAHTDNSKNRYWTYEDSLAWTEQTKYTFFRIGE